MDNCSCNRIATWSFCFEFCVVRNEDVTFVIFLKLFYKDVRGTQFDTGSKWEMGNFSS